MRTEIKELHQRLKTTTIYVTHDQIEAMTMADRIVVMHDGVVEQIGPPLDLYDRPDNLFVAGFIGSPAMNFLSGQIRANGSLTFVTDTGLVIPLTDAPAGAQGKPLVLGIRPSISTSRRTGSPPRWWSWSPPARKPCWRCARSARTSPASCANA